MNKSAVIVALLAGGLLLVARGQNNTQGPNGLSPSILAAFNSSAPVWREIGDYSPVISAHGTEDRVKAKLSFAESLLGVPLRITSFVRSIADNIRVGGAEYSKHLTGEAVDISTAGHDRATLLSALRDAGFTGFGFYEDHIHADIGPVREWYENETVRQIWNVA